MGDCQSKNKINHVSEPTTESGGKVAGSVEEIPVKHKPENGRSFGQNMKLRSFFNIYIQVISGKLFQFTSAKPVSRLEIHAGNFFA